jgi:ATP-dependent DNA helicase RecG
MTELPRLPVFSESQFFQRFGRAESSTLEFKESFIKANKLQEPVVAFANTRGGRIAVGVTKTSRVVGISWNQEVEERIQEVARITQPPVAIEASCIDVDGRTVAVLEVAPLEHGWVQTSDGRLIVRAGPTNRTLVGQELLRFVTSRAADPVEDQPVRGVTADDLDGARVREFVAVRLGRSRFDLAPELVNLGFVKPDGRVRLSTLLLFGESPQAHNRRFGIDFMRLDGSIDDRGVLRDRRQITGTLSDLADKTYRLLYEEMRRDAVVRGLVREEVPEYPTIAIREALLNALGHRDYSLSGSSIQVRLFADGVEIESPGTLPAWVTVENLIDAQYSRNPRIMDAFHVLHFVEEAGTGIDKILAAMEDALLEPPEFEEREQSFVVRFRGRSVFAAEDRLWISGFSDLSLGGHEKVALVFAHRHGAITNAELRQLRHLDSPTSRRVLQDLVSRGLLDVVGERRGTRYVLSDLARRSRRQEEPDDFIQVVVGHAARQGSVANRDVRGLLGIDAAEARSVLETAVAKGLLIPIGQRRARRYLPARG